MSIYSTSVALPYILFACIQIFCSYCVPKQNYGRLTQKTLYVYGILFSYVSFLIFFGLRGGIFSDWYSYKLVFDKCPTLPDALFRHKKFPVESLYMEIGFRYYVAFFKTFLRNYFIFQSIDFFIDFLFLQQAFNFFLEKKDYSLFFSCLLALDGVYIFFIILRNAKVIVLFLYSLKYFGMKRYFWYFFLNFIGFFFHSSAIIYVIIFPILFSKCNRKLVLLLYVFGNIVYILDISFANVLLSFLADSVGGSLGTMGKLMARYTRIFNDSMRGINIGYLEKNIYFLLVFFSQKRVLSIKPECKSLYILFYCYMFLYLYFSDSRAFIERLAIMFSCSLWFLLPSIYNTLKPSREKTLFKLLFQMYVTMKVFMNQRIIAGKYYFAFQMTDGQVKESKKIIELCNKVVMKGRKQS